MYQLIMFAHVLVSLSIVVLVLLQHGKGADIGASFGSGASQTVFGSTGSGSFMLKLTGTLAAVFFATSLVLAKMASYQATEQTQLNLPVPTVDESNPTGNSAG